MPEESGAGPLLIATNPIGGAAASTRFYSLCANADNGYSVNLLDNRRL